MIVCLLSVEWIMQLINEDFVKNGNILHFHYRMFCLANCIAVFFCPSTIYVREVFKIFSILSLLPMIYELQFLQVHIRLRLFFIHYYWSNLHKSPVCKKEEPWDRTLWNSYLAAVRSYVCAICTILSISCVKIHAKMWFFLTRK